MAYCTPTQFVEIFGEQEAIELTNLTYPQAIALNELALQRALDDATSLINGYLQNRSTLPLPTVPEMLISCCADIARYRLDRNRCRDDVRERFDYWMNWLRDYAKGLVNLGLDQADQPVGLVPDLVYVTASDRVFTNDSLRGYA